VRNEIANGSLLRSILDRGVSRGEVDPDRLTRRIVSLPTDLARHKMLMTLEPLSDDAIREIVDGILLPLVRQRRRPVM
jgi:Tetracyclin repressor-like, C-terminal domain